MVNPIVIYDFVTHFDFKLLSPSLSAHLVKGQVHACLVRKDETLVT